MNRKEKLRRLAWAVEKLAELQAEVVGVRITLNEIELQVQDGETLGRELSKLSTTAERLKKAGAMLHGLHDYVKEKYPSLEYPLGRKCQHCGHLTLDGQRTTVLADGYPYHRACWKEMGL